MPKNKSKKKKNTVDPLRLAIRKFNATKKGTNSIDKEFLDIFYNLLFYNAITYAISTQFNRSIIDISHLWRADSINPDVTDDISNESDVAFDFVDFLFEHVEIVFIRQFNKKNVKLYNDISNIKFFDFIPCYTSHLLGLKLSRYTIGKKARIITERGIDFLNEAISKGLQIYINPDMGNDSLFLDYKTIFQLMKYNHNNDYNNLFTNYDKQVFNNARKLDSKIIDKKLEDYQSDNSSQNTVPLVIKMAKQCLDLHLIFHEKFDDSVNSFPQKDNPIFAKDVWDMLISLSMHLYHYIFTLNKFSPVLFEKNTGLILSLVDPTTILSSLLSSRTCQYNSKTVYYPSFIMNPGNNITIFFTFLHEEQKILLCHFEKQIVSP